MLKFIRNLKLEHKIMLSLVVANIFFAFFSLTTNLATTTALYNRLLYQMLISSSTLISHELDNNLTQMEALTNVIRSDANVQSILDEVRAPETIYEAHYYSNLYAAIQKHYSDNQQDYLRFVAISCPRFVSYTYGYTREHPDEELLNVLIDKAEEADGSSRWITDYALTDGVFLVREIKKTKYLSFDPLGTILIKLDCRRLIEEISTLSKEYENSYWLIYDDANYIYSSSDLDRQTISRILFAIPDYGITEINGEQFFGIRGTIESTGWHYLHLLSYEAIADAKQKAIVYYFFFLIGGLVLSECLVHFMIRKITRHFDLLIMKMKFLSENSDSKPMIPYDYSTRNDEIGMLHRQFDHMANEIQTLVIKNYKQELLTKEAQLKSLESQINPHFLYNTLESINWRAKAKGEEDISQMVEALGHFLRMTLTNRGEHFSLKEELEIIRYYMTIQQLRFDNRLSFHLHIPESYQDACIPQLSIQPLLENAVHYALEQITDDCMISLTCVLSEGILKIYVKNSGSEFEDDLLNKLRLHEIQEKGCGIALLNIEERIKLQFGEEYGLHFYNEDEFAVVMLEIPYIPVSTA